MASGRGSVGCRSSPRGGAGILRVVRQHNPIAFVADDEQTARAVERELLGALGGIDHVLDLPALVRPPVDTVLAGIREVDIAIRRGRDAGDVVEPVGEPLEALGRYGRR